MRTQTTYRLIVGIISIVIISFGVYMVTDMIAKENDIVEVVTEPENVFIEEPISIEVPPEKLIDVEVKYVDIYEECAHEKIYTEHYENTTNNKLKDKILNEMSLYSLTVEQEGMLIFERKYDMKCKEHYLVKMEENRVVVHRINEQGKYEYYQDTSYTKPYIREDLVLQLETGGIYVDGIEELFMLLEDIEG